MHSEKKRIIIPDPMEWDMGSGIVRIIKNNKGILYILHVWKE